MVKKLLTISAGIFWLAGLGVGESTLLNYSAAPAMVHTPPSVWPMDAPIALSAQHPTLLMLIHPRCPCTRASIRELSVLMAHAQQRLNAYALFLKPPGTSENWTKSDLWHSAAQIPGVTVLQDPDGMWAHLFSASVSGQTLLYDTEGRLVFYGGITAARGHEGDNFGRTAIESFVIQGSTNRTNTPVFGCALFNGSRG